MSTIRMQNIYKELAEESNASAPSDDMLTIVYDQSGTIIYQSSDKIIDYSVQHSQGKHVADLFPELDIFFQDGLPKSEAPIHLNKNQYNILLVPSFNASSSEVIGGVLKITASSVNATREQIIASTQIKSLKEVSLENEAQNFVSINEALADILTEGAWLDITLSPSGIITSVKEPLGAESNAQLVGNQINQYVLPESFENVANILRGEPGCLQLNIPINQRYRHYHLLFNYSVDRVLSGIGFDLTPLVEDISNYKMNEQVLSQTILKLTNHITERTQSLEAANKKLQEENFERKLAELALRKTEERFKIAVESVSDVIYEWDVLSGYINWFGNIDSLLGYRPGEFPRTKAGWEAIIHPDDYHKTVSKIKQHLRSGEPYVDEYRVKHKNGSYLYWRDRGTMLQDESGQPHKWIGVMSNITAAKEAEEALIESEELYRSLVSATAQIVWTCNPDGSVEDLPMWRAYTGQSVDEVEGIGWLDAIHLLDRAETKKAMREAYISKSAFDIECRIRGNDFVYRYFQVRGVPILNQEGMIKKWVGTCLDVNERRQIETELKKSEESYRYLSESLPQMIWTADAEGYFNYFNSWAYRYTGLQQREMLGWGWINTLHPDDVINAIDNWKQSLAMNEPFKAEYRVKHAESNEFKWHLVRAIPIKDIHGQVSKWLGTCTDIDDQKTVERTLRDNEQLREAQLRLKREKEFTENLINNSMDGIVVFDESGRLTVWNKVMEQSTSLERQEVIGKSIFEIFPALSSSEDGKKILDVLNGDKIVLYTMYNATRKGYFEIRVMPVYDESMTIVGGLGFIHDITERRKIEKERTKQKLKQQKEILKAILQAQEDERKRIAEALHNGLGQLLYAVKLNQESLSRELNSIQAVKAVAISNDVNSLLEEAIKETRTLSFQLMPTILEDFGLETVLKELSKKISGPTLSINCYLEGMESRLNISLEIALYRIIQELLNNTIKHAQATETNIYLQRTNGQLTVNVTDNGIGFDHHQTLKAESGTGLRSIKNRVKLLAGTLTIQSEVKKGTSITIALPLKK